MRAGLAEPDSPRIHVVLAEAYREQKSLKEAEAEYQKAIQLRPDLLSAHIGLATAYWGASEQDKAIPELRKALELNPRDPEAAFMMGDILVAQHQFVDAMPYLDLALRGSGTNLPRVHALRGKAYAAQGQTLEAIAELKQSLAADPDGSYHYQLYQVYKQLGDVSAATEALRQSESIRNARNRKNAASD